MTPSSAQPCAAHTKVKKCPGARILEREGHMLGDMIEFGILDPTKVTRTALQNATETTQHREVHFGGPSFLA